MKNPFAFVLVLLVAVFTLSVMSDAPHFAFDVDGDQFDGPLGWLFGLLFGGVGLLVGCVVLLLVGVLLTLVFTGVGVLLVVALLGVALVMLAALSPVLLPLLIPIAIIGWWMKRSRDRSLNPPL